MDQAAAVVHQPAGSTAVGRVLTLSACAAGAACRRPHLVLRELSYSWYVVCIDCIWYLRQQDRHGAALFSSDHQHALCGVLWHRHTIIATLFAPAMIGLLGRGWVEGTRSSAPITPQPAVGHRRVLPAGDRACTTTASPNPVCVLPAPPAPSCCSLLLLLLVTHSLV